MSLTQHPKHRVHQSLLTSLLLFVLGISWLTWLYRLREEPCNSRNIKCHQVSPILRSTLNVFTWLLLISSLYFLLSGIINGSRMTFIIFYVIFVFAFAAQIVFIRQICANRKRVCDKCFDDHWKQTLHRGVVIGVAMILLLVGLWGGISFLTN